MSFSAYPVIDPADRFPQLFYLDDGTVVGTAPGDPNGQVVGRGILITPVGTYVNLTGGISTWGLFIGGSVGASDGQILVGNGAGGVRASNWILDAVSNNLNDPNADTRIQRPAGAFTGYEFNALLKQIQSETGWALERDQALTWSNAANNPGGGLGARIRAALSATGRTNLYADTESGVTERLTELSVRTINAFNVTSSVTQVPITGLSIPVENGRVYNFDAFIVTTSNVAAGIRLRISGPAMTLYRADGILYEGAAINAVGSATAIGTNIFAVTAVTAAKAYFSGVIAASADGDVTIDFAQNVSNGAASSVLAGSRFNLHAV